MASFVYLKASPTKCLTTVPIRTHSHPFAAIRTHSQRFVADIDIDIDIDIEKENDIVIEIVPDIDTVPERDRKRISFCVFRFALFPFAISLLRSLSSLFALRIGRGTKSNAFGGGSPPCGHSSLMKRIT